MATLAMLFCRRIARCLYRRRQSGFVPNSGGSFEGSCQTHEILRESLDIRKLASVRYLPVVAKSSRHLSKMWRYPQIRLRLRYFCFERLSHVTLLTDFRHELHQRPEKVNSIQSLRV